MDQATTTRGLLSRPGFLAQLGTVWAMFRKEFLIYLRYPMWLVSAIVGPVLWMIPNIGIGLAFIGRGGDGSHFQATTGASNYLMYLVIGGFLWGFVGSVLWNIGFALKDEMWRGTLEHNWLAPVPRFYLLVGRSIFSIVTTTVESFIAMAILAALFPFQVGGNILAALGLLVVTLIGLYGIGFIFCGLVMVVREPSAPANIIQIGLMIVCGTSYPIWVLPGWLQAVGKAIPLTYGIDAIRAVLLGSRTIYPLGVEVAILLASAVLIPAAGYAIFQVIERRARVLGTLGQF
ncbi:MAG: ABC transporter permease [Bacillota bacterium]